MALLILSVCSSHRSHAQQSQIDQAQNPSHWKPFGANAPTCHTLCFCIFPALALGDLSDTIHYEPAL